MTETEREQALLSLEQREVALARALLRDPGLLDPRGEASLRWAIQLSRLHHLKGPDGEVDLEETVLPLRTEVLKLLEVAGLAPKQADGLSPDKLRPISSILREQALRTREALLRRFGAQLPPQVVDDEVRHKVLAIAAGGGGGSAHIHLGAFKLLQDCGIQPALIAGTSMGAILGLFRARAHRYDTADILAVMRSLSFGKIFQLLSMESRYGLPAALRLYLRASMGRFFQDKSGQTLTLNQLEIPLITSVCGIRSGMLPKPLEYYERLLEDVLRSPTPFRIGRKLPAVASALIELVGVSERLEKVYLGLDAGTQEFDVIDAVGFSSSLPGVIHYDIVRRDDRMHEMMFNLFTRRDLYRLCDGGLTDNVPARAAWLGVQRGMAKGRRNAFVLAIDGFSPKLSTPAWLPMQSIILGQVARSTEWAHAYKAFKQPLSPLELVPNVENTLKAVERGQEEMKDLLPLIKRMLEPLPVLE